MPKISIGLSTTVNFARKTVEFSKIEMKIEDIDLENSIDSQLKAFDEKMDVAYEKIKISIKKKLEDKVREMDDGM